MKRLSVLLLLLCSGPLMASAVYKWTDKNGRVHYSDKPVHNAEKVKAKTGTAAPANPEAETERAKREAECKQQREQLDVYQSAARLVERDNLGNEREYTAEDKQRLIQRTQEKIKAVCGPLPPPPPVEAPPPPAAETPPEG